MAPFDRKNRDYQPKPEILVARRLMAGSVSATSYPAEATGGVASDVDGDLWWTEPDDGKLVRLTKEGQSLDVPLPDPGSEPRGIAYFEYSDTMVFTEAGSHKIGVVVPSGVAGAPDQVTEFSLPTPSAVPGAIVNVGDAWFVETLPGGETRLGEFDYQGVIVEFALPAGARVVGLAAGPDSNPWFVDAGNNAVGTITRGGVVTEYPVGTPNAGLGGIALGSDGNLWFTEAAAGRVGRMTTSGVVSTFPLAGGSVPASIAEGPDGNLWVTETIPNGPALVRVSPRDGSENVLPLPGGFLAPTAIAQVGLDAVGFIDPSGDLVGKVATDPTLGYETYTTLPQDIHVFEKNATSLYQPLVRFSTSVGHGSAADFTATIDWGDGSPAEMGKVSLYNTFPLVDFPTPTGFNGFVVAGGHTYDHAGVYTVHVSITDLAGRTADANLTATISTAPLAVEGNPVDTEVGMGFSETVGYLDLAPGVNDSENDAVTIDWGDGTTTSGHVQGLVYPPFIELKHDCSINGNHVYASLGDYTIRFTVTNLQGNTASATTTAHVGPAGLVDSPSYLWMIAKSPQSAIPLANFSTNAPDAASTDYVATVDWGDGTTSTAQVRSVDESGATDAVTFQIVGDHEYDHGGIFSYRVTLTMVSDGSSTTSTGTSTVHDPSQFEIYRSDYGLPDASVGQPFQLELPNVASYNVHPSNGEFNVTVDWGDGSPITNVEPTIDPSRLYDGLPPEISYRAFGTHTFAAPGVYYVKTTYVQADGKSSQAIERVTVVDPNPENSTPADPPTLSVRTIGTAPTPNPISAPSGPPTPVAASPVVRPLGVSHLANTPFSLQARYDVERLLGGTQHRKVAVHHAKAHPKPVVHRAATTSHLRSALAKTRKQASHAGHHSV